MLEHQRTAKTLNLVISGALCMLPGLCFGSMMAYIAQAVAYYQNVENPTGIVMTDSDASWFASMTQLLRLSGTMIATSLNDRLGRRITLLISVLFIIGGSVVSLLAYSYIILCVGLFLMSVGSGITVTPSYSLLNDISVIRYRGSLGSLNTLTVNLGILYGLVFGMFFPVPIYPYLVSGPALLFIVLYWKLPESPLWLFKEGKTEESKKILQWLRGSGYNVEPEVKEFEFVLSVSESIQTAKPSVMSGEFLKPAAIISCLFLFQATSGADALCYYMFIIFANHPLNTSIIAIIFQACITFGYVVSPLLLSRVNRIPQLVAGCLCMSASICLLGLNYILTFPPIIADNIPIFSLCVCGLMYGLGVGPVPFILMSEIFPAKFKESGVLTAMAIRGLAVFLQLKIFSSMESSIGMGGIFLAFACSLIVSAVFTATVVPETRNKSLSELEQIFKPREAADSSKLTVKPEP